MLICIEGCLGVGKSTLVQRFAEQVPCTPFYEDVTSNPFLLDFYQQRQRYALHVQYTFLLLQERIFRQAVEREKKGCKSTHAGSKHVASTVVCDFHPCKSLIFASVVLPPEARPPLSQLYQLLHIPQPDLVIYLRADEHTILARLRKRHDVYHADIDFTYVTQICSAYDTFFRTYSGPSVTIDTTHIDYAGHPEELGVLLQQIPLLFAS